MTAKAQGQGVQQLCSYFCIPTQSVRVWSLMYYFTDIWVTKRNKLSAKMVHWILKHTLIIGLIGSKARGWKRNEKKLSLGIQFIFFL